MMMTIRTHDQYNTTIYGLNDRYRGVLNERRIIFMNENDMKSLHLKKLDLVDLTSHFKNEKREANGFLVVPYNIPKQCTATYFPEANVLVPLKSKADISNTPASKTVIITIKKDKYYLMKKYIFLFTLLVSNQFMFSQTENIPEKITQKGFVKVDYPFSRDAYNKYS